MTTLKGYEKMKDIKGYQSSNSTDPSISENFGETNYNDLDGVPEGIIEKQQENQNVNSAHPYMGNLTSHEIGMMAKTGSLNGEMFKRMTSNIRQASEDGPIEP